MQRLKAFNMTELMLVMMILGVILVLTLPLAMNIKDDDKIFAGYKGKANKDIADASQYALLKNRAKSYSNIKMNDKDTGLPLTNDSQILREFLSSTISYKSKCQGFGNTEANCLKIAVADFENTYGLKIQNGEVIMFNYDNPGCVETACGRILVDMNGDKKPNTIGQDRYTFTLFRDRAVIDD
ncbi:MAG: type II secretion system protein [Candidatus Gastranaerophilales bacterium]|nr:type II secretion system protein [Candidatus Gastranaerophilales bacterium]